VKRSLAPGSRVVTEYLRNSGLQPYLDKLGFNIVGYGCTTCMAIPARSTRDRRSGHNKRRDRRFRPLRQPQFRSTRSPEHQGELPHEPAARRGLSLLLGTSMSIWPKIPSAKAMTAKKFISRISWPSLSEIRSVMQTSFNADTFKKLYHDFEKQNPLWEQVPTTAGVLYEWDPSSTYIQSRPSSNSSR
jgi:aconitate hydratase